MKSLLDEHLPLAHIVARGIHAQIGYRLPIEDLLQYAAMGLMDALRSFDKERQVPLRSYVRAKVRHRILDGIRGQTKCRRVLKPRMSVMSEGQLDELFSCDKAIEDYETRDLVRYLLQQLRPTEEYVCRRYFLDGATSESIARELGITKSGVMSSRARGLQRLRTQFNREGERHGSMSRLRT